MSSLGIGVMLHTLGGSSCGSDEFIGKTIALAKLEDNALLIEFSDGEAIEIFDDGQSCCETRYMSTDDDVSWLVGKKWREASIKSAPNIAEEGCDEHEVRFLEIMTEDGCVTFANHNIHNGCYGGFAMKIARTADAKKTLEERMTFTLASIHKGQNLKPPRVLLYGVSGVGKTNFGAHAPKSIFIPTEDGGGAMPINSFPISETWDQFASAVRVLLNEEHEYESAVVDSVDWLERLVWAETCSRHGKDSIESFGYGKGYTEALKVWGEFIEMMNALRDEKGMTVIMLGHAMVKTFNNPDGENYDRYQLAMHQKAGDIIREWVDVMLFANYEVKVRKQENAIDKSKGKAVKIYTEENPRVVYTEERPAFIAKNRYSLPPVLPFPKNDSWAAFADAMDQGIESTEELVAKLKGKAA
jgi:hypothetical protein